MATAARGEPFTPVRRERSFDVVVGQLEAAIADGHFEPGQRLPTERDLAELLGVSRPTLREALRAMEVLGALEIRVGKGGGTFVAQPRGDTVGAALAALIHIGGASASELREFRASFEGETAAWAARRATGETAAQLRAIAGRYRVAAEDATTTWPELIPIDVEFHEAVAAASRNRVRVAVMHGLLRAVERVEMLIAATADQALHVRAADDLDAIATAIADGDPDAARAAMTRHVEEFGQLYERAATGLRSKRPRDDRRDRHPGGCGAILDEAARRRTFAIISHPDAGKTTLTEKLLLYGGQLARGRRRGRQAQPPGRDVGLDGDRAPRAGSRSPPRCCASSTTGSC